MKKAQFVKYLQGFIILSPLPFGCVGRFYMPLFYLLLLVPVLLILAGQGKSLKPLNSGTLLQEKQIRFLFYGFVLFLALQVIPLPMGLLKILSPAAVTTLEQTKTTIPTFYSLSQVPVDTLEFGFRFLAVSLLFVTIISLRLSKWHIFTLLNTLILSASLQAAFGLIKFVTGTNKFFLFFHEREVYSDRLSGTLGNVDHFAFYLEMILPLALCLLFMKMKYFESRRSIRARFIAAMNADRWVLVYSGAVILLGAAIILTGSRGGIIALVLSFLVFAQLTLYLKRTRAIRKKLKWIFLAVALVATFVGIQGTMNRFMETRIESGGRFLRWPNTVTMVKDFPVFGSGFGTTAMDFTFTTRINPENGPPMLTTITWK